MRILRVTVCECHIQIKGYLLIYLFNYTLDAVLARYMLWLCVCPSVHLSNRLIANRMWPIELHQHQ